MIATSDREKSAQSRTVSWRASDSKVVVDHASDLPSAKEPILSLSFLFLQTNLFLKVGILDDLVRNRCNSRVQHLKIRDMSTLN